MAELVDATDLKSVEGNFVRVQVPSSPPSCINLVDQIFIDVHALVAQLDRALDYGSRGYGFNSCRARHIFRDVAQLGSAPGLGPGGRRFESCHPDHFLSLIPFIWRVSSVG